MEESIYRFPKISSELLSSDLYKQIEKMEEELDEVKRAWCNCDDIHTISEAWDLICATEQLIRMLTMDNDDMAETIHKATYYKNVNRNYFDLPEEDDDCQDRIATLEFALEAANKVIAEYEARYGDLGDALNPDAEVK